MSQPRFSATELKTFSRQVLIAAGVDSAEAHPVAAALVWADLIGRPPQGVSRLPVYLEHVKQGSIMSPCNLIFEEKTPALHLLDGQHGLGHYLAHRAINRAVELAEQYGVGAVGVRHANHFGAAAYYVNLAAEQNKLGLALCNATPKVVPYGGKTPIFGTNPLAFGAPTPYNQAILIDLATSAVAGSTIRYAIQQGQTIPAGAALGPDGCPTTDPQVAAQGVLLPFGGVKGFCLGLMVEILSGLITGAAISHEVGSVYKNIGQFANTGYFFLAVDIAKIMPLDVYYERMDTLIAFIKAAEPLDETAEILLPGEQRWRYYEQHQREGIALAPETLTTLNKLAQTWGVDPL